MSKALDGAKSKIKNIKNAANKFTASAVEGTRLIPSRTKDKQIPVRIDAGHYNPTSKRLNVVMQVNSKPESPGLENWVKKHTTHGKLAKAQFNIAADDKNAEWSRMLDELMDKGKQNLKDGKQDESDS